jgi:hypothetical protein
MAALIAGFGLIAAACAGGGSAGDESVPQGPDPVTTEAVAVSDANSDKSATSDDVAAPGIDPSEAATPDGGDGSGADGHEGDGDEGGVDDAGGDDNNDDAERDGGAEGDDGDSNAASPDALPLAIAQATAPWPTDWSQHIVGLDEFQLGIGALDPRDRIPPIDNPEFQPIADADWLGEREPGALVQFNDEIRFYPLAILTRHEIVNDNYGDVPIIVTFCPLCNTAISFDARVDGQTLRFGVSGLLRNSDLVMWDDATTSLWQQITGESIVGEFAGTQLELIPTSIVAYGDVLENFPDAVSLSTETGFPIQYGTNPYQGYSSSSSPFLFDGEPDPRFPALSRVVGATIVGADKAYPFSVLSEVQAVNDEVGGLPVAVFWGGDTADALDASTIADGEVIGSAIVYDRRVGDDVLTFSADGAGDFIDAETGTTWTLLGRATNGPLEGEQLQTVTHRNEFWFAWAAFFPAADVYNP